MEISKVISAIEMGDPFIIFTPDMEKMKQELSIFLSEYAPKPYERVRNLVISMKITILYNLALEMLKEGKVSAQDEDLESENIEQCAENVEDEALKMTEENISFGCEEYEPQEEINGNYQYDRGYSSSSEIYKQLLKSRAIFMERKLKNISKKNIARYKKMMKMNKMFMYH
ncbi:MAG: hypothetical protein IJ809_04685 [Clostridia bacterium]|nr:hypothetical protein [Clostridia bacterium]